MLPQLFTLLQQLIRTVITLIIILIIIQMRFVTKQRRNVLEAIISIK